MGFEQFQLKIRRAETGPFRVLKSIAKTLLYGNLPSPRFLKPVFGALFEAHWLAVTLLRRLYILFYAEPIFRARCQRAGKNLSISSLPFVVGHVQIHLGDNVSFTGPLSIFTGRFNDAPQLVIGNRSAIGAGSTLVVNKELIIEDDVIVAPNCRIQDSDGHPTAADLRAANSPLSDRDIQPVRICKYAWIGTGSIIMKGVTIGEGAVVSANSVVVSNVPPYTLVMGNPGEVMFRNFGKPSRPFAS